MKEEKYRKSIELTEEALNILKKMPKEKQMYVMGIIKGLTINNEDKPQSNIA
nr:MAG: hypothetical protein [Bacteriophage sp.]UWD66873.1 MAG: hypothetical protein [Bacteriophage sp.]UWF96990.1 MAG: hypothetical protein [Bacteriophage sp.]DAP82635.1 MAG TPA: Heterogeneous nuclear ribonucleoprotein [Caudoviricetes sp.]